MAVDVLLPVPAAFDAWRDAARRLLAAAVAPEDVAWRVAGEAPSLFAEAPPAPRDDAPAPSVPRAFVELAEVAIRHRDPERFALLYRVLWRLQHGERALMTIAADPDVARLEGMAKGVRRDAHRMHAFLRFREVATDSGPRFLAWFEPEHHIEEAEAAFFVDRFAQLRWSIVTPRVSLHWDGAALSFGPGGTRADVPREDAKEDLWRAYYRAIFNPARLKPATMRGHMPRRYWAEMPETREIPHLMAEAPARAAAMVMRGATPPAPRRQRVQHVAAESGQRAAEAEQLPIFPEGERQAALDALRAQVMGDNAAPLAEHATQAVFGEGPLDPPLMLVGEQPGDEEDLKGRPFVGPAGRLLDAMLEEAGVSRPEVWVTNAVKHFKFTPTGKRRLHQSPNAGDIAHYRPFLIREIAIVRPRLILALGGTAAQALLRDNKARVGALRGREMTMPEGPRLRVTVHPSYLLRLPDEVSRARERGRFLEDLRAAAAAA